MSSVIYIKASDDNPSDELLEYLHKYSDQAVVWTTLFLEKIAELFPNGLTREEWVAIHDEIRIKKDELKALKIKDPKDITDDEKNKIIALPKEVDELINRIYYFPETAKYNNPQPFVKEPLISPSEGNALFDPAGGITRKNPKTGRVERQFIYDAAKFILLKFKHKIVDPTSGATFHEMTPEAQSTVVDQLSTDLAGKAWELFNPFFGEDFPERLHQVEKKDKDEAQELSVSYNPEEHTTGTREYKGAKFGTWLYKFIYQQLMANIATTKRKRREQSTDAPIGGDEEDARPFIETIPAPEQKAGLSSITPLLQEKLDEIAHQKFTGAFAWIEDGDGPKWVNRYMSLWRMFFLEGLGERAKGEEWKDEDKRRKFRQMAKELKVTPGRIHNLIYGERGEQTRKTRGRVTLSLLEILDMIPAWKDLQGDIANESMLAKQAILERFFYSLPKIRKEGGINYALLRNKIQDKLDKKLFTTYTNLYEKRLSNPETARVMKLSPPRITGLKKKIIASLLELPEISSFFENSSDSTSPLHRFIYKAGDRVKVDSINKIGTIAATKGSSIKVSLDNGNTVFTIERDIEKYCSLIESIHSVLDHYFSRSVYTPQCYLSAMDGASKLILLELRPKDSIKTTARLHINSNLIEVTEFTEEYPDNLISIVKGHLGKGVELDPPFTTLFHETNG